jgi:hypothetical protein
MGIGAAVVPADVPPVPVNGASAAQEVIKGRK